MKSRVFIGTLLIGLFLGILFIRRDRIVVAPVMTVGPSLMVLPFTSPMLRSQLTEKTETIYPVGTESPAEALFFEIDGNKAVFYEDIILGEVREAGGQESGLAQAPRLFYWANPIPYALERTLPMPERVESAIRYFNENTPVKFVPFAGETDAIVFVEAPEQCRSYLGKHGGIQPIYLAQNCGPSEIMHEIMHALGFVHEQSRSDRDEYLEILWENIEPKQVRQFQKIPETLMEPFIGSAFDFTSIMLYKPGVFAKSPGLPTMMSKTPESIQPSQQLSPADISRLERIFGYRQ